MTQKYDEPRKHQYSINLTIDMVEIVDNLVGRGSRSEWIEDAIQRKLDLNKDDYVDFEQETQADRLKRITEASKKHPHDDHYYLNNPGVKQ